MNYTCKINCLKRVFRDFLTGFHKRKVQRQKDAKEKFEKLLKDERKRLKSDAKESYKKLVVSHRTIPELEHLLAEEYEDDEVTVKVTELSTSDIAKQNHWIGPNKPKYDSDEHEEIDQTNSDDDDEEEQMPGMELKEKITPKQKQEKPQYSSQKEIKKVLKKQATKNIKKSKVFQRKNKMEQLKQKKKSSMKKKEQMKLQKKFSKKKAYNKQNK